MFKTHSATSQTVPESIPGGVTGNFFRGSPDGTMCPEVNSASEREYQGFRAYGWRNYLPNVKKIRGLNLRGTPWATSACWEMTFTLIN